MVWRLFKSLLNYPFLAASLVAPLLAAGACGSSGDSGSNDGASTSTTAAGTAGATSAGSTGTGDDAGGRNDANAGSDGDAATGGSDTGASDASSADTTGGSNGTTGPGPCGCAEPTGHPVCGSDHRSHPSACLAACASVNIVDGCGCEHLDGSVCACTNDIDLVCGNDGQTWTNACLATQAGVGVVLVGVCGSGKFRGDLAAGAACDAAHDLCSKGYQCCPPPAGTDMLEGAPGPSTCTMVDPVTGGCPRGA